MFTQLLVFLLLLVSLLNLKKCVLLRNIKYPGRNIGFVCRGRMKFRIYSLKVVSK